MSVGGSICAGSPRSSFLDTAISINISYADSYVKAHTCKICTRGVIVNGIMANNTPNHIFDFALFSPRFKNVHCA